MRVNRRKLPAFAFTASLILHAMLLTALQWTIDAAAARSRDRYDIERVDQIAMLLPEEMPPEPEETPQEEKPTEIELGIDAPMPPSPTWIGYDEPQPQLAERFENEQAAFTDEPVAAAPPQQPSEPQPEPALSQADPQQAQSQQHSETAARAASVEETPGEITSGTEPELNDNPKSEAIENEPVDVASIAEAVKKIIEEIQEAMEHAANESLQEQDSESRDETTSPSSQQTPSDPKPQIAPQPQEAVKEIGTPADKESSPTSIIDVPPDQWQLGKPLARHGLQLKPRRPTFTLLTLMTASPGNPLCLIKFGRDGVPIDASLLKSSGDKRVDDAVLASLYRWRAEGAELRALAEGKTLDVRMRIILNRRAAAQEQSRAQADSSN